MSRTKDNFKKNITIFTKLCTVNGQQDDDCKTIRICHENERLSEMDIIRKPSTSTTGHALEPARDDKQETTETLRNESEEKQSRQE